jgi:hypothetical protein
MMPAAFEQVGHVAFLRIDRAVDEQRLEAAR